MSLDPAGSGEAWFGGLQESIATAPVTLFPASNPSLDTLANFHLLHSNRRRPRWAEIGFVPNMRDFRVPVPWGTELCVWGWHRVRVRAHARPIRIRSGVYQFDGGLGRRAGGKLEDKMMLIARYYMIK
jgi:hypothetical protein